MHRVGIAWCAAGWLAASLSLVSAQSFPSVTLSESQVVDAMQEHPLAVARQYLLVARSKVLKHHFAQAADSLTIAAEALAYFEEQDLGERGRDAGFTRQAIIDYARSIETDHADAVSRIDNWLSQIQAFGGE
jgi:hypothetical protein